jgi:hypothetical protein
MGGLGEMGGKIKRNEKEKDKEERERGKEMLCGSARSLAPVPQGTGPPWGF